MPTILEAGKTIDTAADLLTEFSATIPNSAECKNKWISAIKNQVINRKEPKAENIQQTRVSKSTEESTVDSDVSFSNSPTCPQTLCTVPQVH